VATAIADDTVVVDTYKVSFDPDRPKIARIEAQITLGELTDHWTSQAFLPKPESTWNSLAMSSI